MDSTTVEHRLGTEGADYLLLAGINDAHLLEVARLSGCRVILRGDTLILSGDVNDVERALPVAEQLVQQARIGQPFDVDDIRRYFQSESSRPRAARQSGSRRDGAGREDEVHVLLAGLKKLIGSKSEGQRQYLEAIANNDATAGMTASPSRRKRGVQPQIK